MAVRRRHAQTPGPAQAPGHGVSRRLAAAATFLALAVLRPSAALLPSTSWDTVPMFAHIRWFNFTEPDLQQLSQFRSVTIQMAAPVIWCEDQARDAKKRLQAVSPNVPVLFYNNVLYSEPECAYAAMVEKHPEVWLNQSDGVTPYKPGGRYTFDMSQPAAVEMWAQITAGVNVDGGFGDSGCGGTISWFNATRQAAFAAGQLEAQARTQQLLGDDRLFVANCPYFPHIGDPLVPGVRAIMYESWCSDFLPNADVDDPLAVTFCRDEVIYQLALAGLKNVSVQARYYLNRHNGYNPQFGLAAFLVSAFNGSYYGASTDWNWAGDWQKMLSWPWANRTLGDPTTPPRMLDKEGCNWARSFAHANVTTGFCGKHLLARIEWDGDVEGAEHVESDADIIAAHALQQQQLVAEHGTADHRALPASVNVREVAAGVEEGCKSSESLVLAPWAAGGAVCVALADSFQ